MRRVIMEQKRRRMAGTFLIRYKIEAKSTGSIGL